MTSMHVTIVAILVFFMIYAVWDFKSGIEERSAALSKDKADAQMRKRKVARRLGYRPSAPLSIRPRARCRNA